MSMVSMQLLAAGTVATSATLAAVLLVRRPLRAWAGARVAYLLWACVPLALLATLLPRGSAPVVAGGVDWQATAVAGAQQVQHGLPAWSGWLLPLWAAGVLASMLVLAWQQWRFGRSLGRVSRRDDGTWQARQASPALPAVAGLLRPRIILPGDFEARYSAQEQLVVLEHERQHLRRADLQANALAALLRCVFWFNPLFAIAWRCFRHDQELACDAAVLARYPQRRRDYGEAMLKAHVPALATPLGCHWQVRHPLHERIELLSRPLPSRRRVRLAAGMVVALGLGLGYAAWAMQPPSVEVAPAGAMGGPGTAAYAVDLEIGTNGEVRHYRLLGDAGQTLGLRDGGQDGSGLELRLALTPGDAPDTVLIDTRVSVDGQEAGRPRLLAGLGQRAGIELGGTGGTRPISLGFTVTANAPAEVAAVPAARTPDADPVALVKMPPPRYPAEAARAGVTGEVVLVLDVDAQGSVSAARVERSQPAGVFDAVSLEAARQWRFQPALKEGRAVPGQLRVPVTFELDHEDAPEGGA